MIGELIPTGYTYDSGRTAINYAFSGAVSFNILSATTFFSGSTNLEDIINIAITGDTIISAGTNISVTEAGTIPKTYTVNLENNISLNSISATTISASTLMSGSTKNVGHQNSDNWADEDWLFDAYYWDGTPFETKKRPGPNF